MRISYLTIPAIRREVTRYLRPAHRALSVTLAGTTLPARRYRWALARGALPPRDFHVGDYHAWFARTGTTFVGYLQHWEAMPVTPLTFSPPVGVVVTPWAGTPSPWYALMLAIGLSRRGRPVTIIWDDTGFPERNVEQHNETIEAVLTYVRRFFPVVRVSRATPAPDHDGDAGVVEDLTRHNMTWILRGAAPQKRGELIRASNVRAALSRSLPLIRGTIEAARPDLIIVPGGVYANSGLFRKVGTEQPCRVATYDGPPRVAKVSSDGVTAQAHDIPRAFHALLQEDAETRQWAIETAKDEFRKRQIGTDSRRHQAVPAQTHDTRPGGDDQPVVIPLNVEWDTAALGMHIHFSNTYDWLASVIEQILEAAAVPVVVRQHTAERHRPSRSRTEIAAFLRERFPGDARVIFVAADDPLNTYDLFNSARLVLPYVSTVGIEAAAMGKPVVPSGSSYYMDLGFVWASSSREQYLSLVRRGVMGDLPLLADQVERAWLCYYLTAVRYPVATDFTAHPEDFWSWCRRSPHEILKDPAVSDLLTAIDEDQPLALLRHQRALKVWRGEPAEVPGLSPG